VEMDFFIKTEYNIIFFAIIIIVSVLIALYYYRKSTVQGATKTFLTVIRGLTIFFLLLLLASPVISFISILNIEPVNIFLIDNSKSLQIEDRFRTSDSIYQNVLINTESDISENRYYFFSKYSGETTEDSIIFFESDNTQTNLTAALIETEKRFSAGNISSINIISDGIINEGGNPIFTARTINAPVNYILIGDTTQKSDLLVKNVFYNKSAFIESNVPIKVEINSYNYNRAAFVNLYEEDKLLTSQEINLNTGQIVYNVDFSVTSLTAGVKKYKVEIVPVEGEITVKNNYEEFFIKFVDNSFKVLVLSGGPSSDNAFIKEEISKIRNFETTFLTQKAANTYYEGTVPDLKQFRVFILVGYPVSVSSSEVISEIGNVINSTKASVFFFASRNTDYSKLNALSDRLPFKAFNYSESEIETGVKSVSLINDEVFRNSDILNSISSLPNVFKSGTHFTANPSSETMLLTSSSEPAFIIQNTDDNHSAAMLVHGLYKWRLSPRNTNGTETLNYLLSTTTAYIADKDKQKKFFIETTRPVYSKFEEVKFSATLNDPDVSGGEEIKVKITGNDFNEEIILTKINNLLFEGTLKVPNDGDYSYSANLSIRGEFVEEDGGRFLIGENNYEFKETRSDNSILSSLANETGGENFSGMSSDEISDILKIINEASGDEIESLKNFSLNINPYFLTLIILLMCIEWFFRKRNNLP
jgi:hypothetical protein